MLFPSYQPPDIYLALFTSKTNPFPPLTVFWWLASEKAVFASRVLVGEKSQVCWLAFARRMYQTDYVGRIYLCHSYHKLLRVPQRRFRCASVFLPFPYALGRILFIYVLLSRFVTSLSRGPHELSFTCLLFIHLHINVFFSPFGIYFSSGRGLSSCSRLRGTQRARPDPIRKFGPRPRSVARALGAERGTPARGGIPST